MPLAFLFDLDMTLVDSSHADSLRYAKKWTEVYRLIPSFGSFGGKTGPMAHEVPGLLHEQGHKIAIVTSSPRPYAEKILSHFEIYHDTLIAYHDTEKHKPDPEPITAALRALGMPPNKAIFIGDAAEDFQAASAAKVYSVAAFWGMGTIQKSRGDMPDAFLESPVALLGDCQNWALLCEYVFSLPGLPLKGGVIVRCDPSEPIYTLGRYFQIGDRRHAAHKLSTELLRLKNADVSTEKFAHSLHRFLKTLPKQPDYLLSVPPKPGQRNRFTPILELVSQYRDEEGLPPAKVDENALVCREVVAGYKGLHAQERSDRIADTIDTKYNWNGASVVLVDDIYTTGSTMRECIRALKCDGAGWIKGVTFGKDQFNRNQTYCPACNAPMKTRTHQRTGERFLGCSKFPNCRKTLPL